MANGSSFNIPSDWDCRDMGHDDEAPAPERAASPPRVETAGASLRDAVRQFARHKWDCAVAKFGRAYEKGLHVGDEPPCSCGLFAIRATFLPGEYPLADEQLRATARQKAPPRAPEGDATPTYSTLEELEAATKNTAFLHGPEDALLDIPVYRRLLATAKAGLEARAGIADRERALARTDNSAVIAELQRRLDALTREPSEEEIGRALNAHSRGPDQPIGYWRNSDAAKRMRSALTAFVSARSGQRPSSGGENG